MPLLAERVSPWWPPLYKRKERRKTFGEIIVYNMITVFLVLKLKKNSNEAVYINPDTFENWVFVLKRSPSKLALSSIFQKFLIHTETSENVTFALLRINLHKKPSSVNLHKSSLRWYRHKFSCNSSGRIFFLQKSHRSLIWTFTMTFTMSRSIIFDLKSSCPCVLLQDSNCQYIFCHLFRTVIWRVNKVNIFSNSVKVNST